MVATGEVISQFDFSYDKAGNIIEEKSSSEADPEINLEMTYQAANRLATHDGDVVQFDADGNLIKGPLGGELVDFAFDSRNRLTQAGSTTYRYDAENQRVGVNQTQFVVNSQPNLSQVLVKNENGNKTFYVYGLGLIGQETGSKYTNYHFDLRGSTVALTNSTGQVTERFQYSPYGLLLSGNAEKTPFLFNGMYGVMSDSNGLYYMRARFYSPEMRRFVNQDILLGFVEDGQTLNRYAYVTGNPVSFVDPNGNIPIIVVPVIIWTIIEGGLTAYDAYNTTQTILDPDASSSEKWGTACLFVIGMALPGGGYSSAIKWKGFSKGKLKSHYDKHVVKQQEFGNITQAEYLNRAKSFAKETGSEFQEIIEGNFVIKYDPATGRVLVGHSKSREIRTFYIDDGRDSDPLQAAIDYAKSLR